MGLSAIVESPARLTVGNMPVAQGKTDEPKRKQVPGVHGGTQREIRCRIANPRTGAKNSTSLHRNSTRVPPVGPSNRMNRVHTPLLAILALTLAGCSSAYYSTMEKFGYAKRELLVSRVEDTRQAQGAAKEQFASTLAQFLAVARVDGGDLQKKYDEANRAYSRSEARAKEVRDRIDAVENVAEALFREWKQELRQYSNASLRAQSERQLTETQQRYDQLIDTMRRAAARMDPVLATFKDQVLFLKHNLNARALASLDGTNRELQTDIRQLIAEMDAAIREADAFIRTLQLPAPTAPAASGADRQPPTRP